MVRLRFVCGFVGSRFGCVRRGFVGVFLLVCLLLGLFVGLVGAQGDDGGFVSVFILSDGSVVGSDLVVRDGDVYTLTGDIFGTIKVERGGVTIDGAGHTINSMRFFQIDDSEIFVGRGVGLDLRKNHSQYGTECFGGVLVQNIHFYCSEVCASSHYRF